MLQEDKEPLFDSVETINTVLDVTAEFAQNVVFNKDRISKSLPAGHLDATTLADYLVYKVVHNPAFFLCVLFCFKSNRLDLSLMSKISHVCSVFIIRFWLS